MKVKGWFDLASKSIIDNLKWPMIIEPNLLIDKLSGPLNLTFSNFSIVLESEAKFDM